MQNRIWLKRCEWEQMLYICDNFKYFSPKTSVILEHQEHFVDKYLGTSMYYNVIANIYHNLYDNSALEYWRKANDREA